MPTNILMPALSPTMEKGNLAKWLKKEGDTIKSGDVIAEIETDKATMEVEAVDEGVLAKIVVPEGTADVPVNQLIGLIAAEGEDAKAVAGAAGQGAAPSAKAPAAATKPPDDGKAQPEAAPPSPRNRRPALRLRPAPHHRPLGRPSRGQAREPTGKRRVSASSLRRSRDASPRTPASTSPRSRAQARMGGSSSRT